MICRQPAATIEVIAPHTLPDEWQSWQEAQRAAFTTYRKSESYYLRYDGPGGSNGWVGNPIDRERAGLIIAAFSSPPTSEAIRATGFYDGAGFCERWSRFYCPEHWAISETGYGTCPKGHGKGLDPHWHPD
jgi:hypothetical protein